MEESSLTAFVSKLWRYSQTSYKSLIINIAWWLHDCKNDCVTRMHEGGVLNETIATCFHRVFM